MATRYKIVLPDGEQVEFEGPDGMTDEEITHLADTTLKDAKPGESFQHSVFRGGVDPVRAVQGDDTELSAQDSSATGSFLRGMPKDALFNFNDEIASFVNAGVPGMAELDNLFGVTQDEMQGPLNSDLSFWDRVKANQRAAGEQAAADEALHPVASGAGRIAGLVSSLPRIGGAVATRLPEEISSWAITNPKLTATALGGTGAAISGAGAGSPGNRGQSAALGLVAGAPLGFAASGATELVPAVAHYAKILMNKGSDKEAVRQIVKALHRDGFDVSTPEGIAKVKAALEEYTGKPVSLADLGGSIRSRTGVGLRAPSEAQQPAIDAIRARQAGQGQRLANDVRTFVAPRTDVHAIDEALTDQRKNMATELRDKALFEDAPVESSVVRPESPNAGLLRTVDTPVKPVNDVGTSAPAPSVPAGLTPRSPTSEEALRMGVTARTADVGTPNGNGRVQAFIQDDTVDPPTLKVIVEHEDGSRGKYDPSELTEAQAAEYTPPEGGTSSGRRSRIVDDPTLQQLARLPDAQKALQAAAQRAESERGLLAVTGENIDHIPDINLGSDLDMRTFDYLKRFMDDEVRTLFKKGDTATFKAGQAHQVKALRDEIRDRLRAYNPDYADYLDAYSGSSQMLDALEEGRLFSNLDPEEIAAAQGKNSQASQEMYRVGAARNLIDTIRGTPDNANAASRILGSPEARDQLAATGVADDAVKALFKRVNQERTMNRLPEELGGAQTAQRLMAQSDANAGADIIVPFNPGSPTAWAGMLGRKLLNATSINRNAAVNEALLPRVTETDPAAIAKILDELEAQGRLGEAQRIRNAIRMQKLGGSLGVAVGGPVSIGDQ